MKIKLEIIVDTENVEEIDTALSLFNLLKGDKIVQKTDAEKQTKQVIEKETRLGPPPQGYELQPEAIKEKKANAPIPESSITIEDVRAELAKKVMENREAIKEKLKSLEADNVTKLDPANYAEMFNFLKNLD